MFKNKIKSKLVVASELEHEVQNIYSNSTLTDPIVDIVPDVYYDDSYVILYKSCD